MKYKKLSEIVRAVPTDEFFVAQDKTRYRIWSDGSRRRDPKKVSKRK